mgnify:CR=1 FL=1
MGASCEEIIALASQALTGWDAELVQKVNTIGGQIDESERTIETICMKLLLRQGRRRYGESVILKCMPTLMDAVIRLKRMVL